MKKKMNKAGGAAIVIALVCISGCSFIELRSPVVIHTGQKAGGEAPAASVQTDTTALEPSPSAEVTGESTSPASIPVLADQELSQRRYSSLGRITVTSQDKKGFTSEQAEKDLKIMAFKRFGALAQGIAKIEYQEKSGLFSEGRNIYREASAEVMTMATAGEAAQAGEQASVQSGGTIPSLENIVVVSSDELFNRNFKVLGKVTVRDTTPEGMSEEQAVKSLKIEAYRLFGSRVKGLSSLKLKKEYPIYFYKKPQFSPPPQVAKGYNKATAEVLYWP
jgi:hypothetical protein